MALGTTDITTTIVKNALGEDQFALYHLADSPNINKFSKYKPVIGTAPAGTSGYYGLNLPDNWNYISITSDARLGDFRGYEHTESLTLPPVYTESTGPTELHPTGSPYAFNFSPVPVFNSASAVRINTADIGINGWYLGLRIVATGGPWYKTGVDLGTTGDQAFGISAELINAITPAYSNLPYGADVNMEWSLIISNQQKSTWTATAPTVWMTLPTGTYGGKTMTTSGTFYVSNWVALSDTDMIFTGAAGYQPSTVYCSEVNYPQFSVGDNTGWITTPVYDGETLISNPDLFANGMTVRVTVSELTTACIVSPVVAGGQDWTLNPTYTSGSLEGDADRSGTVTVTSGEESSQITVTQGAAGSDQLTFGFRSVDLSPGDTAINVVITRGATTVYTNTSGSILGRDGYTKSYTVTINETGIAGETYTVTMSRH